MLWQVAIHFWKKWRRKRFCRGVDNDLQTILYRQSILKDCLNNPSVIRSLYALAVEAVARERKIYFGIIRYPTSVLSRSIEALQMFVDVLKRLRKTADEHAGSFESKGFTTFFTMISEELSNEYFDAIQAHLKTLKFRDGILISARLGRGNKGSDYTLRKADKKHRWPAWLANAAPRTYTLQINDRDESGAKALRELRDRGINIVANVLAQSNDHILSFFTMLRNELAFYVGCLNLHEQLVQIGLPICFPQPAEYADRLYAFEELTDVCLALIMRRRIVGNRLNADDIDLIVVTGANQGGKSTFLRSIGLAQIMMQCGMFVSAEAFRASICDGLFTHFKREEDITLKSGKLDEELSRMSDIVQHLTPHSMLLLNESFATTNEREGAEIAGQIVRALIEARIKVCFVTHSYEFAHDFYSRQLKHAVFLRAERQADGQRTFKMIVGEPLQTSYGADLYAKLFESGGQNG